MQASLQKPNSQIYIHYFCNRNAVNEYNYSFSFIIIYNGNELININSTVLYYSCMFAFICSVLAYFLYFKILETNGAGNLLICTIIIPPSSILLNAFFINEIIKIYELIGLIIITLGLIILDGRIINYIKNRFI